ncbi:SMC-Scp complex subunit ScpB [Alicyclobacillus fastidiosus]|uniref:Segregation and condensation protein B n=1 Tax=Alicyclobacillus fastidiosus TaxID=392011 RepID=A0ABY6ZQX0_9BACL|nr:SMC-Scp complex subunit ScpB [Alicyclobacillus fastidiosus]WAH44360.1 SMC-Scp complex subunit ScpB [Alicyclobacillus fastidiosus]GMA60692.1 segregation and condensation protein B [Alicyclobacillus fastidiosus]
MQLLSAVEAILFAAGSDGLQTSDIAHILDCSEADARNLCHQLRAAFNERGAGITLQEVADTWQLTTRPELAPFLKRMAQAPMQSSLSAAALEVLAIISYKQPITRAEIDEIRGVQSDRALATLVHRQLVREVGRQDAPGRPILFGTTEQFLRHFGLKSLSELPPLPPAPEEQDVSLFALPSEIARD